MKTLDEVINLMEDERRCDVPMYKDDALHYLKEFKRISARLEKIALGNITETLEKLDNPALTWDELKQMEGKPVWVEYNLHIGNKDFRDKSKRWCIVREFKPWHDTEIIITENGFVLSKNEQIKCWQAYRKERS